MDGYTALYPPPLPSLLPLWALGGAGLTLLFPSYAIRHPRWSQSRRLETKQQFGPSFRTRQLVNVRPTKHEDTQLHGVLVLNSQLHISHFQGIGTFPKDRLSSVRCSPVCRLPDCWAPRVWTENGGSRPGSTRQIKKKTVPLKNLVTTSEMGWI